MIDLKQIRSVTDFVKNAKAHVARLKRSGKPEVLTVNGAAAVVVQSAGSYQKLLDRLERAEAIAGIQRGLDALEKGNHRSHDAADAKTRRKHKIPRTR